MSLINKDQLLHITYYYKEKKLKGGFVKRINLEDEKAEAMLKDEATKGDVKVLNTYWKIISWDEQQEMTKKSTSMNPMDRQPDFDVYKFRDLRLKASLKKWDLVDDDGKPVECNEKTIGELPPNVILNLINKFDTMVNPTDDEEKN